MAALSPLTTETMPTFSAVYKEGWLIVQCQYYKLEQVSERGYRLLPEKRYLVVNTMIRLKGL